MRPGACARRFYSRVSAKFGCLRQAAALLAFQTGCDEVADAAWCPSNATVFAAATAGGRLEVRLLRVARTCAHACSALYMIRKAARCQNKPELYHLGGHAA